MSRTEADRLPVRTGVNMFQSAYETLDFFRIVAVKGNPVFFLVHGVVLALKYVDFLSDPHCPQQIVG